MADAPLILHGEDRFQSPYVFSVFVVLTEKGLPFELRTRSLAAKSHRAGDYALKTLTGRVPALQHGDLWLAESSAIDEYLEEAFPPPRYARLYPEGLAERARARQLQAWFRSDLLALREQRPTSTVFGPGAGSARGKSLGPAQEAADWLLRVAEALVPADAGHLFGAFSIADVDLALMLQRLVSNGDPVPDRLRRYVERVWSRPSVQDWLARERAARGA